jgi:hypothetical protein
MVRRETRVYTPPHPLAAQQADGHLLLVALRMFASQSAQRIPRQVEVVDMQVVEVEAALPTVVI